MAEIPKSEFKATGTIQDEMFSANLPAYVLDSTVRDVMKGLVTAVSQSGDKDAKGMKDLLSLYEKSIAETGEVTEAVQKAAEKAEEQADEQLKETKRQKAREQQESTDAKKRSDDFYNSVNRGMEKGARMGGDLLMSSVKTLAAIVSVASMTVFRSFSNLGNGLKTLTDQGQSFGDQLSNGTQGTTDNIIALNQLGFTTEEAVSSLAEYSRAASTLGQSTLIQLNKEFLNMTGYGQDLGVTLDEASEFFLQDQQYRARTLNKDKMNNAITASLTVQSIKNLRGFSSILGQSGDALRQSAEGVMDGNKAFQAYTNSLDPTRATNLNSVAKSLVEGLIAVFPQSGEEIGNALLTVAGTGVGAISEFANMLIPLGGSINQEFLKLSTDLRNGAISIDQVPQALQGMVEAANLNADDLQQLSVISGLGGEMGAVADTIITMTQEASVTRKRLTKLASSTGMQYDDIQKATIAFENIQKSVKGGYSSLLNAIPVSMIDGLGTNLGGLMDALSPGNGGLSYLNKELSRAGKEIGTAIANVINRFSDKNGGFANTITMIIDSVVDLTTRLVKSVEDIINSLVDKNGNLDLLGAIKTLIGEAIGYLIEAVGLAFSTIPWTSLIPVLTIVGIFTLVGAGAGAAFGIAAHLAGAAFAAAALRVSAAGGMGGLLGGKGGFLKGAGNMAMRAAPYLAAGMVAKDGFDVVAGTDGGANKENTYGLAGGAIGGVLGGLLGSAFFGIGAVPGAAIGAGIGNMAGNFFGGRADEEKTINKNRKQAQFTSPSMQGPITSGMNARYMDTMTDPNIDPTQATQMTSAELNTLDRESPESKALVLILAEQKRLNRQISAMVFDGLKTVPEKA